MKNEKHLIQAVGNLVAYEQEGGFAEDGFTIGNESLSRIVSRTFGVELNSRHSLVREGDSVDLGPVRLTLERINVDYVPAFKIRQLSSECRVLMDLAQKGPEGRGEREAYLFVLAALESLIR